MIPKKELKNKHVEYIDKDGKHRIAKVVIVSGSWLSLKRFDWTKYDRVHKSRVICRMRPKQGPEEIRW